MAPTSASSDLVPEQLESAPESFEPTPRFEPEAIPLGPPETEDSNEPEPARPQSIALSPEEREQLEATPAGDSETELDPLHCYYVRDGQAGLDPSAAPTEFDLLGADEPLPQESEDTLAAQFGNVDAPDLHSTRLEAAEDPQRIGEILLESLAEEFATVLLFQVRQGAAIGWMGRGEELDESRLFAYRVSFEEPSIFLNLREGGNFFVGVLPEMSSHLDLAACWQSDLGKECAVLPIRVQDRLVCVAYGDRGAQGLEALDLDKIQRLTRAAADAFERSILKQKTRHSLS
jgi:hypothetical protein